jgi:hypothetical protein
MACPGSGKVEVRLAIVPAALLERPQAGLFADYNNTCTKEGSYWLASCPHFCGICERAASLPQIVNDALRHGSLPDGIYHEGDGTDT